MANQDCEKTRLTRREFLEASAVSAVAASVALSQDGVSAADAAW